jgi:hypothetical protein
MRAIRRAFPVRSRDMMSRTIRSIGRTDDAFRVSG